MARPSITLSLLLAVTFSIGHGIPLSSPCTKEEITNPITTIHGLIEKMQSPDMDANSIMEEIKTEIDSISQHIENVKNTCGEEKSEDIEKLEQFMSKIKMIDEIITAMDSGEIEKAKNIMENIQCEHLTQYIIRKYGTNTEKIGKIIDMIKIMDNMDMINTMNEGIIYIIDESNIIIAKDLIPIMKMQILDNKDKMSPEMMQTAKLNLKEIAKRAIPHCYEGLIALNEIDHEMADQAMYEAIFQMMSDSIYTPVFKIIMDAPTIHKQAIGMQAVYDKIIAMEKQNSYIGGKLYYFADKMMNNEQIKNEEKAMEIINNIINNATLFAKNMAKSYSCQSVDQIKSIITGEDIQREHNDYMIFYNPESPEIFANKKFSVKPDGDMMMITLEKAVEGKTIQYSMVIENAEYPEDFNTKGIISKTIIGSEETNIEELCAMNPTPQANICIPFTELYNNNMEEIFKIRKNMYESFQEKIKTCSKA